MELRLFGSITVQPDKDTGDIEIPNAEILEGSHPKDGVHFYHHSASGLVNALMPQMAQAMKKKKIIATVEINVTNLKRDKTGYSDNSPMYLKVDEVKENECLMLHLISAPLRSELIECISSRISDEKLKNELAAITADHYFLDFIRNNPEAIDYIHQDPKYNHFKAIVYPVNSTSSGTKMCALYNLDPAQVSVKLYHKVNDVTPILPSKALADQSPLKDQAVNKANEGLKI